MIKVFIICVIVVGVFYYAFNGTNKSNNNQVKTDRIPLIEFASGNHAESTLYVDSIGFNNKFGIRPSRWTKCSIGVNFYDGGGEYRNIPVPQTIEASWEHELSNSYYRVSFPLHPDLKKWLQDKKTLPIQATSKPIDRFKDEPSISIYFRSNHRVEAWLIVYGNQPPDKTAIKLGDGVGVVFESNNKLHVSGKTYRNRAGKIGITISQGSIYRYDRFFDGELTKEERYGCWRDENDLLIEEKIPRRYPFLTGLNGELLNCTDNDCYNLLESKRKWRKMIKQGTLKTGTYTKENPYPLRIHPKLTPEDTAAYKAKKVKFRKETAVEKERIWICLNPPEPCFRGIAKDYGLSEKTLNSMNNQQNETKILTVSETKKE